MEFGKKAPLRDERRGPQSPGSILPVQFPTLLTLIVSSHLRKREREREGMRQREEENKN